MQKVNASSSIVPVLLVTNDGSTASPAGNDIVDPISGHTLMGGSTRNVTMSGLKRRRETMTKKKKTCLTNTLAQK